MAHNKRLAVCLFGHLRTYRQTYKNFFRNIIEINKKSGYEIDIFIHTWDVFCDFNTRHRDNLQKLYPTLWDKKVNNDVIKDFCNIYHPKSFAVENGSGMLQSIARVSEIYLEYKNDTKIHYDFILYARFDVMYFSPLDFSLYIESFYLYNKDTGDNKKITFSGSNYYSVLSYMKPDFVNEGDMIWINNFDCKDCPPRKAHSYFVVPIKYNYYIDYIAWREITQYDFSDRLLLIPIRMPWVPIMWPKVKGIKLYQQPQAPKEKIITKEVIKEKPIPSIYLVAKDRIHNHLAYKLGSAMILNSKSLWGYIRMPYVLSYIKAQHSFEQEKYQKAIAKNPSLKLPKLESYPNYKEALREKQCFTYKLGEALIKANSVRGGGANICLPCLYPKSA